MIGARLLDRYELTGVLGRGGMGVVYRARDPRLDRDVAVKMIPPAVLSDEAESRFRREAQLVAKLDHPNITPIFDFGVHEGSLFLVMPVLEGRTLDTLIRERSLHLGEAIEIIAQAAEALDYSHHQGVLHRDVKPENLMILSAPGELPRVRIMDFGLAVAAREDRLTRTGQIFGTLAYVSPERASSSAEDARSDIYALATVLYECLAGEPPFSGAPSALLYRIVHEHPRSFRDRGVIIDQSLEWIVLGCLAKAPEDRLQRGRELATALRRYNGTLAGDDDSQTVEMPAVPAAMRAASTSPALVGRDAEVLVLQRRLNAAAGGAGQLVLIGGEPGVGKTRLVEELTSLAEARGVPVLHGRFSEQEATFPYQGFCEVIQDHFRRMSRAGHTTDSGELGSWAHELRRTFPMLSEIAEIASVASGTTLPPRPTAERAEQLSAGQAHVFEVLARSLARIADGAPLVVVLDQLHNADVSIEAMHYVVHRLGTSPILMVGTYRSNAVGRGHELRRLQANFEGSSAFASLTIGPLSRADHGALLAALVGEDPVSTDLASKLFVATEGNPFFTQELVRASIDSGGMARDESGMWIVSGEAAMSSDALPETIHQVVRARLEGLPAVHRRFLVVASVLGRSFRYDDLEALMAQATDAALGVRTNRGSPATTDESDFSDIGDEVDQLVAAGLLLEDTHRRGDGLRFASSVMREVLYASLGRRRRRRLHRSHARHLEQRWADRLDRVYPQLAHHFAEGDVLSKAVHYGLAHAQASLEAFQVGDAIRALDTVLDLALDPDGDAAPATVGETHALMAHARRAAGQLDLALRHADLARASFETAQARAPAAVAARVAAEIAWQARRVEPARRRIEKGLDLARGGDDPATLFRLLELGAMVANLQGQHATARHLLDEAAVVRPADPAAEGDGVVAGGQLVTVLPNRVTCLEPGHHEVIEDSEVMAIVFEPLVRSDESGLPVPMLSAYWRFDDDGLRCRFTLRPEPCFSDGTPLRAHHVKASLERSSLGGRDAMEVAAFDAIEGVAAHRAGVANGISGIVVDDEHTVTFVLRAPLPILPILLSDPGTGIALPSGDAPFLLGTGPFRLVSSDHRGVDLARNPHGWNGPPPLIERLRLRTDLDAAAIDHALRDGQLDVGRDLRPEALADIQRDPRFRGGLVEITKRNIYFLLFNRFGPVGRNDALRAALFGAVRVQDIVWRTLGRFAQPSVCLIPPGILGHDPGRRPAPRRPEDVAALLERSGLSKPIRLRAGIHPQWMDRYHSLTETLVEDWRRLGVEVEVVASTLEDYLPLAKNPEGIDLLLGRWFADYDDPDNFTYGLLHSQAGHYCDYWRSPEADGLIERARLESRADVRQRLYRKFERLLVADRIVMPMFHDIDYRIAGPRVRRLRMSSRAPFVDYRSVGLLPLDDGEESSVRVFPERGTLRVPLPGRVDSLDPCGAFAADVAEVVPNVFETLVRVEDGAALPWLASSFDWAPSARRLRLVLRDDVRFHDDRRLTVRDVRYSFERALRSGTEGAPSGLLLLRGARAFRDGARENIDGLEIRSAHELVLRLERPCAFFPLVLAMPSLAIVPDGSSRFTGTWRDGCAGTGPFRLVEHRPDERVALEVHPEYWRRGYPRCQRLIFQLGCTTDDVVAGMRSGRLALAGHIAPSAFDRLRNEDTELARGYVEAPGLGTYYVLLNARRGPLAERRRRVALAQATNRAAVMDAVGRLGTEAHGLIPPGLLGYTPTPRTARPPKDGRAALEGVRLTVALDPVYHHQYAAVWQQVEKDWRAAGVVLDTIPTDEAGVARIAAGEVDVVVTRWLADYPDSDAFAHLFHAQDGLDRAFCADDHLDALIEAGRHELDPALRHTSYRELDHRLVHEAHVIPLFHEQIVRMARPEVVGLRVGLRLPEVAYEELTRLL